MTSKLSGKVFWIAVLSIAALVVAGTASVLASRAPQAAAAPKVEPGVAPAAPQAAAVEAKPAAVSKAVAAPARQPRIASASGADDAALVAADKREARAAQLAAAAVVPLAATPVPVAARTIAPAAVASPEPTEDPETEHPAEVQFQGPVDSISGSTYVVGGQPVATDSGTDFPDGTPVVGAWVEVEGFAQPNGSVLATKISIEHPNGEDVGEVEFTAPIESMDGSIWVIGGQTVDTTGATIDESRGTAAVGAIAEVKATLKSDGTLLATLIKIEDAVEFENEVEFKGTIDSIPDAGTIVVGGRTVDISTAAVEGTLAVGKVAEVHGSENLDGSVKATLVHVEDPIAPDELQFTGTVEVIGSGSWTIGGQVVLVNADTIIDESRGPAVVGAKVEVKAVKQGTDWLAVRIQVEND